MSQRVARILMFRGGCLGSRAMWWVMLSIGKIAAGPRAARYYTDQVAHGREDYYSGEGEESGRWIGSAVAAAGLGGDR